VGFEMRPPARAPFTVYSEEHVQELIAQVDGHLTGFFGQTVPLSVFLNDVWQSAKRQGYIEGLVQAQKDLYAAEHGHKPPASVVGDWRKQAARKAMCGEDDDSI